MPEELEAVEKARIRGERRGACMNKKEESLLAARSGEGDADGGELHHWGVRAQSGLGEINPSLCVMKFR